MPLRASASSASNSSSLNGAFSAVPWISTMPARAGHHEIGVGLGGGVLGIVEVEHRRAVVDAAGDGGDLVAQRVRACSMSRDFIQARQSRQRDPGAGDRGRAGAAIGLDHVAVDGDLAFAERLQVDDGAQRAADQALDFLRAAALLAGGGLAPRALMRWRAAACRIRR